MNDIKKAIEYFEVSKNCIPKNETKEYRTLFIEVANTAIQALQEKQEREKGCEYCNDFSFIQKGYFVDNRKSEILGINNCCINCGRKLGEK